MAEMENDDEISLIDLLAALLRWRRLIIGLTVGAALAAAVVLFVFPALGLLDFSEYSVKLGATSLQIPPQLKAELAIDPPAYIKNYALDTKLVGEALIRHRISGVEAKSIEDPVFRSFVAKSFVNKIYTVSATGDFVTFQVTDGDPERAVAFLREIIASAEQQTRNAIAKKSALIGDSLGRLVAAYPEGSVIPETAKQLIISSAVYRNDQVPVLAVDEAPEVLKQPAGRAMKLAVAVFAAFFASVFLTFLLEAFEGVKKDPESKAKLAGALRDKPSLREVLRLK